jgi:hypothetical protein
MSNIKFPLTTGLISRIIFLWTASLHDFEFKESSKEHAECIMLYKFCCTQISAAIIISPGIFVSFVILCSYLASNVGR